jgi:hypothetical protein
MHRLFKLLTLNYRLKINLNLFYFILIYFIFNFDLIDVFKLESDTRTNSIIAPNGLKYHNILYINRAMLHRLAFFILQIKNNVNIFWVAPNLLSIVSSQDP